MKASDIRFSQAIRGVQGMCIRTRNFRANIVLAQHYMGLRNIAKINEYCVQFWFFPIDSYRAKFVIQQSEFFKNLMDAVHAKWLKTVVPIHTYYAELEQS